MLVQQCWVGFLKEDVVITEPFSIESKLVHERSDPLMWAWKGVWPQEWLKWCGQYDDSYCDKF